MRNAFNCRLHFVVEYFKSLSESIHKIKRPALSFHHEDIHIRLDFIEEEIKQIKNLLIEKDFNEK